MKAVKKLLKDISSSCKSMLVTSYYCHHFYHSKIKKSTVLLESRNGLDVAGNIFYIMKELSEGDYGVTKIYLSVCKSTINRAEKMISLYNLNNVRIVRHGSPKYYKLIATVNYIFTDTSLQRAYIKKEGQIFVNTWHGTPLKRMGKYNIPERHSMGNIQRNLLFSDYLVFPNDYMREKMLESYNIDTSFNGEILLAGYPRNTAFFEVTERESFKEKLGFLNKEVFVYMPTWKSENMGKKLSESLAQMRQMLSEIDEKLLDNQVFLLKLHPLVKAHADVKGFKHIKLFPETYEAYSVLNCADVLVTDYSSVFFDFSNTKKKIVLFTPDEEKYDSDRGFYFPLSDLPFTKVGTVDELICALNNPKDYDDDEFIKRFCTYDNQNATRNILAHIIKGENTCKVEKIEKSNKEKVLLYCGALLQNGLTAAFKNLLSLIDLDEREYYFAFKQSAFSKHPERLDVIPSKLKLFSMSGFMDYTFVEGLCLAIYYKLNRQNSLVMKYVNRAYSREFKRHFNGLEMDHVINFSGYDKYVIALLQQYNAKKTIFVHSDMEKEIKLRNNQHKLTLVSAYRNYDNVAAVTKAMGDIASRISGRKDNVVVVSNCFNADVFVENSTKPIEYQKDSRSSVHHPGGIEGILSQKGTKIISVGRYSPEKQHQMLIDAFAEYNEQNPDSYLIIIGGGGNLYSKTVARANSKKCSQNIACLWSIANPMPIVKQCDLFVLCSKYEALGLVMLEADAVGVPVICTEMDGPKELVESHSGTMVENSKEGLIKGFCEFEKGNIKPLGIDYVEYNKTALEQFESLFN